MAQGRSNHQELAAGLGLGACLERGWIHTVRHWGRDLRAAHVCFVITPDAVAVLRRLSPVVLLPTPDHLILDAGILLKLVLREFLVEQLSRLLPEFVVFEHFQELFQSEDLHGFPVLF